MLYPGDDQVGEHHLLRDRGQIDAGQMLLEHDVDTAVGDREGLNLGDGVSQPYADIRVSQ